MNKYSLFFRLIRADIKRTKKYIPSVIISVFLLLAICSASGIAISKYLYKEGSFSTVRLAYFIPEDSDQRYNMMAINMLQDMQSIKSTATLTQVSSIDEGYEMIDNNEILFFIIVPEHFFTGIVDSTNTPITIVVRDNTTITSYVANELFMSYAGYLGTAQASIYSALDTMWANDMPQEEVELHQDRVNLTFLDRALNKDTYLIETECTNEGAYSLTFYYLASAVMVTLFFLSIVLMPMLQGHGEGILLQLNTYKINKLHIFLSNIISCILCIYIGFIPCFFTVAIISKVFNPVGLITILPYIILISAFICIAAALGNHNLFAGNMISLVMTIVITYLAGGILPPALLPTIIQTISEYTPGKLILSGIAQSLFGF